MRHLILDSHMGAIECVPYIRAEGELRYTYPGGRLYTARQLHQLAQSHGWRVREILAPRDGRMVRASGWTRGTNG